MFWLHSDIFDISLKFPPNYLGVHRLTNHNIARTRQINVTHAMEARHVIGVYFFTDSARRDSVLCDQHYCIDRFYASQFLPCACASRSPTRHYIKERFAVQGGIYIWWGRMDSRWCGLFFERSLFYFQPFIHTLWIAAYAVFVQAQWRFGIHTLRWRLLTLPVLSSTQPDNTGSIAPL